MQEVQTTFNEKVDFEVAVQRKTIIQVFDGKDLEIQTAGIMDMHQQFRATYLKNLYGLTANKGI